MDAYITNLLTDSNTHRQLSMTIRDHQNAVELFFEACSALYRDILDAMGHRLDLSESAMISRQLEVIKQGAQLSEIAPHLKDEISNKLNVVSSAMMDLKLDRQSSLKAISNGEQEPTALKQLRKWICLTSEKIKKIEENLKAQSLSIESLKRLAADQQVLQLEIQTEGSALVRSVGLTLARYLDSEEKIPKWQIQRQQQRLKALIDRWHKIWIRSLIAECKIEKRQNPDSYQDDEDVASDPELREPQEKRRCVSNCLERKTSNEEQLKYEEDTIPFAEEEYERIEPPVKRMQNLLENGTELQPDVGYSSGENTNSEADDIPDVKMPSENEATDNERRLRIEASPVKSFYKTVPLDETGATDTEVPLVSMYSGWPISTMCASDLHVLTDSLIVNADDELPAVDAKEKLQEILALFDEDENGNTQTLPFEATGTRWREFKSGKLRGGHPLLPRTVFASIADDDRNSCDASSEESDDLPSDINDINSLTASATSTVESRQSSLKRRYKSRTSAASCLYSLNKSSASAYGPSLDVSVCSNSSRALSELSCSNSFGSYLHTSTLPPNPVGRAYHHGRRKLRARRLPRSMSDGEHLGLWMNSSTYSAPGATNRCTEIYRDSDATAPDQSDGQPYEWDEYNPPAKLEDGWIEDEHRDDMSILTIEDDFQMQLGQSVDTELCPTIAFREKTPLGQIETIRDSVAQKSDRPIASITGNPGGKMNTDENWNFDANKTSPIVLRSTREKDRRSQRCLSLSSLLPEKSLILPNQESISSPTLHSLTPISSDLPLPEIIKEKFVTQLKKFASSLKLMQDELSGSESTLSTPSSIKSLNDIVSSLEIFNELRERLIKAQEELHSFLSSDSFAGDHSVFIKDFEPLYKGYQEAVQQVDSLMSQIEVIREKWDDWAKTQQSMKEIMLSIEKELVELRKGGNNSKQICSELEDCQYRMNRLETMCNYLTKNLTKLLSNSSSSVVPTVDFTSELAIYSNALTQLKARFEQEMRQSCNADTAEKATMVSTRKRRFVKNSGEQVSMEPLSAPRRGWALQTFFVLAALSVFAAWFASSDIAWKMAIGPRLHYVNGPPPV